MNKSPETTKSSAWALFLTAHAVLVEEIEVRLADAGLPPLAWYDVLWALERAGDRRLRMRELADMTVISRSNITRLVDRLETAGLVARERAQEDGRGAFAVLTSAGRAMRKKMWPVYSAAIGELFEEHITERDAAQMKDFLRRILDAVRQPIPEA
ncbi:MAG TPA: MarR family transcriptional regulator [Burkholderiales bacterium]|nr:MarR family transcriptional regulator [Burkholderiales bacterium]